MHELSLAQELFRIVEARAKENNIKSVTRIVVVVGEASGIDGDFLRHTIIDHLVPGTVAKKAKLEIVKEPLELKCMACGTQVGLPQSFPSRCPDCGGNDLEISQGRSVYLQSIEGE